MMTPPTRRQWLTRALAQVALAGVAPAVLTACREPVRAQPVPRGATVLALGDSLTYGSGATAETSYPARLAEATGWRVVNAGVPGDRSADALARLPALLAQHQPALVIVSIGGNDFLKGVPVAETQANIERIAGQAKASGAQVLLLAMPRLSLARLSLGALDDHPLYGQLAERLRLPLQRQGWSEVLSDERLRSDPIHANAQGYAHMARSVYGTAVAAGLVAASAQGL